MEDLIYQRENQSTITVTCRAADLLPVDALRDFQGGAKTLSEKNLSRIKSSILEHGFTAPVFVWENDGENFILDGHQRLKAVLSMREEGYSIPLLPIAYIDAASRKEAAAKLLHITSQYGEFDRAGLDAFILDAGLSFGDIDSIRLTGSELKISEWLFASETSGDDDLPTDAPEITRLGDLWELGNHRIVCGDSTERSTCLSLFGGGVLADLYLTDPPYNVAYEGKTRERLTIRNDKQSDQQFREFLASAFSIASEFMKAGAAFYIWHADSEGFNFRSACRDADLEIRQGLVWIKNTMVMGRQDYQWQHEPCLYGWKSGSAHAWYSDRRQTTTLRFDRPARSEEHPTMKPLGLFEYQILNSSKAGDIVFDNFLGSGTAVLAAEKTGRTCFGVELDPHYCDVIVKRYAKWCRENGRPIEITHNGAQFDSAEILEG